MNLRLAVRNDDDCVQSSRHVPSTKTCAARAETYRPTIMPFRISGCQLERPNKDLIRSHFLWARSPSRLILTIVLSPVCRLRCHRCLIGPLVDRRISRTISSRRSWHRPKTLAFRPPVVVRPLTGFDPGQQLDPVFDGVHRPDVEPTLADRIDDLGREVEIEDVARRDHDSLLTGQTVARADPEKALDLLVDPTDGLDPTVLVHRTGDGDPLLATGSPPTTRGWRRSPSMTPNRRRSRRTTARRSPSRPW